ncbi:MAG TPA: hypothetical protein DCE48_13225 [Lachnospiraceae bacterium]|uniref:alkaline phosphatase family protein n=1 Tax=Anaerosporobacter sp. TaxID=1872529 RepID=UPI000EEE6390|nr:alkaline phosphatase family protein [Anaerosporobacter sp.]HAB61631.1 hypothetical protein [Lachnospiraceae bacterium]
MAKLYVISFEGMNPDILDEYIERGKLKYFKRLLKEGHIGKLKTSRIPYEASGLVSAYSGLQDYEHGVLSYWKAHNYDYIPKTYTSEDTKENMLWMKEEMQDIAFNIVNIFGTHPAYKVNGSLITYAMNRTLRFSYPEDLIRNFASQGMPYVQDMGAFFKGQDKSDFLNDIFRVEGMRHDICKKLMEDSFSDVIIINYTCIDRVCHFYMNEINDPRVALEDKAIYQMYKKCDSILGDILEFVERDQADLIMFSSVGFQPLSEFVEINPYLKEKKLLTLGNDGRYPDWTKTIAFEAVQGTQGININRKALYQSGIVDDSEYTQVLHDVVEVLKQMPNPYNDNPMFKDVVWGSDYYNGLSLAPDIVVQPYDSRYLPYGDTYWSDRVKRHSQTGWHSIDTVWGGIGPNVSNNIKEDENCHITQIAPTIYKLLGRPVNNFVAKSLLKD